MIKKQQYTVHTNKFTVNNNYRSSESDRCCHRSYCRHVEDQLVTWKGVRIVAAVIDVCNLRIAMPVVLTP